MRRSARLSGMSTSATRDIAVASLAKNTSVGKKLAPKRSDTKQAFQGTITLDREIEKKLLTEGYDVVAGVDEGRIIFCFS